MQKNKSHWGTTLKFIAGCMAVGFSGSGIGGAFKKQDWYDNTAKPAIWPPQWFFPLVWIANYAFMGRATALVWEERRKAGAVSALQLFVVHLLHNFLFIPLVYRVKKRWFYVLMDTVGLVLAGFTTLSYRRISKPAMQWMLPYQGWLCFTTFIKVIWWHKEKQA